MALAGIHITVGYSGFSSPNMYTPPVLARIVWSQNMTSPGTAGTTVPAIEGVYGPPIVEVYAVADSFVSIAPAASLNTATRSVFVKATTTYDFIAQPGDSISWTTA